MLTNAIAGSAVMSAAAPRWLFSPRFSAPFLAFVVIDGTIRYNQVDAGPRATITRGPLLPATDTQTYNIYDTVKLTGF